MGDKITVGEILEHEFRDPEHHIDGKQQARIERSVLGTTGLRLDSEFSNDADSHDAETVAKIRQIAVDAIRRDMAGGFEHDRH
ncbi:MAG: hypothetical protein AAB588_04810 [Patescibacteria group bacterium]